MTQTSTNRPLRVDGGAIETILVALDGSRYAEVALTAAATMADRLGVDLGILRVVYHDHQRNHSDAYLADVAHRHPDIAWHETQVGATTATTLLDACDRRSGLLCLASHGHTRLFDVLIGSTASQVTRASTEPVLFVGSGYDANIRHPLGRLVVPVDGTPDSEAIIEWTAQWAIALDLPLHVLTVAELGPEPIIPGATPRRRFGPHGDPEEYIAATIARHTQPNLNITGDVLWDPISAAGGLSKPLRNLPDSVIVIATQAEAGLDRIRHGSTAAALIRQSPVPLLIAPATAFTDERRTR